MEGEIDINHDVGNNFTEVCRVFINHDNNDTIMVAARPYINNNDPAIWGIILMEIAKSISIILEEQNNMNRDMVLDRIINQILAESEDLE